MFSKDNGLKKFTEKMHCENRAPKPTTNLREAVSMKLLNVETEV